MTRNESDRCQMALDSHRCSGSADRRGGVTRRDFLRGVALGATSGITLGAARDVALGKAAVPSTSTAEEKKGPKSLVVLCRDEKSIVNQKTQPPVVEGMVDRVVMRVTGKSDIAEAWRSLVKPAEKVAIKYNGLYEQVGTDRAVIHAVCRGLVKAGVKEENITIFEYHPRGWIDPFEPFKELPGIRHLKSDSGWSDQYDVRGTKTRITKIITDWCDALINLSRTKHHGMCGVTQAMKNHFGSIPNPFMFHRNIDCIADVYALEPIRKKTRILIADALRPMFDKGPHFAAGYFWDNHTILGSTDPVAADTVGAEIITKGRKLMSRRMGRREYQMPLRPGPNFLRRAQELGLGVTDRDRIDVVEI